MKAVFATAYGSPDVLEIRDVPKPVPKENEILIRVRATTVTSGDWRIRTMNVPTGFGVMSRLALGVSGPRQPILGTELAGEVESMGDAVTGFSAGDEVFAFSGAGGGCHAEYRTMPADGAVALKPANLTFEEAAAISFGGTTALVFLRRAGIRRGDRVLVVGASGGVGTAAIQLARHFGAEVTGVCSTANVPMVRSLSADAIDYTQEDFSDRAERYDIIMDTTGTVGFGRARASLKDSGRLLVVAGGLPDMLQIPWAALTTRMRIIAGPTSGNAEDLRFLAALAEAGEYRPVIDRSYPLDRIADAHRYVDLGRKKGNVVISVAGPVHGTGGEYVSDPSLSAESTRDR
ncbi:MAG: NAD(P)-dependent alcohol dehydrogenase [Gemmatimonadetes bacterium]|nr:NAD(P)-dependent alcohol dehydrogenase [Gemmatimonadota bacterium]